MPLNKLVMPAQAGIQFLKWTPAFAGVTTLLLSFSCFAAEEAKPVTYAPETCEFSVTFPSEPYTTRRCDEDGEKKCYDQISYTQVYDMESTINFRVICNPIDQEIYNHYSAEVMEATLRAMTKRSVVQTYDTSFRTEEHYKQAGLVGEGKSGQSPTIYIAQLWIGKNSAFSVEAEMIGEAHDKADKLLSDILRSVHYKDQTKTEETSTDKKEKDE